MSTPSADADRPPLPDLATASVPDIALALCNIPSVSGAEAELADAVEAALSGLAHLEVLRDGNAVVARKRLWG